MAPGDRSGRVLVFAPIGRDGSASVELLRRAGISAEGCDGVQALNRELAAGAAAVFIAEEGLFGNETSGLFDWAANQPAWSELPFIILTSRQERPAIIAWRQQLVASLRNVTLLERPLQTMTLTSAVQTALRARARQYEVRALLDAQTRAAQHLEAQVVLRTAELEKANQACAWKSRNGPALRSRFARHKKLRRSDNSPAVWRTISITS